MNLFYSLIVFKIYTLAVEAEFQVSEIEEKEDGIKATIIAALIKIDHYKKLLPEKLDKSVKQMLDATLHQILEDPFSLNDNMAILLDDWARKTISMLEKVN